MIIVSLLLQTQNRCNKDGCKSMSKSRKSTEDVQGTTVSIVSSGNDAFNYGEYFMAQATPQYAALKAESRKTRASEQPRVVR